MPLARFDEQTLTWVEWALEADPFAPIAKAEGRIQFALHRRFWRGQIVIRWGASTELWDLRISKPDGTGWHFVLKDDPLLASPVAAENMPFRRHERIAVVGGRKVSPFDVTDKVALKPEGPDQKESANPTKDTPAWMESIDRGDVEILDQSATFLKFNFHGAKLEGGWSAQREDPSSPFWQFDQSAGPVVKRVEIFKADAKQQIVYGIVMEPLEIDTQGHFATEAEIEQALIYYMTNYQLMDEQHRRVVPRDEACPVQVFIAPVDIEWPIDDQGNVYTVKKGSWVQATKIFNPELWRKYETGELNAYSIRGWGKIREREHA